MYILKTFVSSRYFRFLRLKYVFLLEQTPVMPNRTIAGSAAVRGVRPSKPLSQFAAASVSRGGRPVAERTLPPEIGSESEVVRVSLSG